MEVLALSIQTAEDGNYIWAIDKRTLLLVKCFCAERTQHFTGSIGESFEVEGTFTKNNYPLLNVRKISRLKEVSSDVKRYLDCKAAHPSAVKSGGLLGRLLRISQVVDLKLIGTRVDLCVKIYGLGDYMYQVFLKDSRWERFWKADTNNFDVHAKLISQFINESKGAYLIMDYEQPSNGAVIESGGMIIL